MPYKDPAAQREFDRKKKARRRAAGVCVYCGSEEAAGRRRCTKCAKKNNSKQYMTREVRERQNRARQRRFESDEVYAARVREQKSAQSRSLSGVMRTHRNNERKALSRLEQRTKEQFGE